MSGACFVRAIVALDHRISSDGQERAAPAQMGGWAESGVWAVGLCWVEAGWAAGLRAGPRPQPHVVPAAVFSLGLLFV